MTSSTTSAAEERNRGHRLKFLTITDEFTRKSLAVVTATSIRAERVRQELERLFLRHDAPECIRSDNGPEFVAKSVQEWLRRKGVALLYIMPGCPWQNAYAESFHSAFERSAWAGSGSTPCAKLRLWLKHGAGITIRRDYTAA